jgi:hypothetical protein
LAIEGFAGVTTIDWRVGAGAVTVSTVDPTTDPEVAVMVLVPTPTPVAKPPAVIVAAPVVAEAQVTEAVRFCVVLLL